MTDLVVRLPPNLDLRDLDGEALRRLFVTHRRFSHRLMFRSALVHMARRIDAGLEERPRQNLRALYYTYGRPLSVASGETLRRPFASFSEAMGDLLRHGHLTYDDLGISDSRWENRRIGGANPGLIVFTEKEGQMRLLRDVHAAADVTIQAFNGTPSTVTCHYLAKHVREALQRPHRLALLAIVDWDPYGYQIARIAAAKLRRFGLRVPDATLILTPDRFTRREIALHAYRPRVPRNQQRLVQRWLDAGGGIDGRLQGLSTEAMPYERLLDLTLETVRATRA